MYVSARNAPRFIKTSAALADDTHRGTGFKHYPLLGIGQTILPCRDKGIESHSFGVKGTYLL